MSCPECFTGTLHEGTPVGRVETIHGLPTYVSDPPPGTEPRGIVVMISDAFGWELPNSRVLADAYAKRGNYTVYLPDFMAGTLMPFCEDIGMHEITATAQATGSRTIF